MRMTPDTHTHIQTHTHPRQTNDRSQIINPTNRKKKIHGAGVEPEALASWDQRAIHYTTVIYIYVRIFNEPYIDVGTHYI
jgi:hypothetical protein